MADLIWPGVQFGCSAFNSAALPAMCGLDIEVPAIDGPPRLLAPACGIRWNDRELTAAADRVQERLNARLWNESRGAYSDAWRDGQISPVVSQQANALMVGYRLAPRSRWRRILRAIEENITAGNKKEK